MYSTARVSQIRTFKVESHCYLSHKICLIKYIDGSMEGQHTILFEPVRGIWSPSGLKDESVSFMAQLKL